MSGLSQWTNCGKAVNQGDRWQSCKDRTDWSRCLLENICNWISWYLKWKKKDQSVNWDGSKTNTRVLSWFQELVWKYKHELLLCLTPKVFYCASNRLLDEATGVPSSSCCRSDDTLQIRSVIVNGSVDLLTFTGEKYPNIKVAYICSDVYRASTRTFRVIPERLLCRQRKYWFNRRSTYIHIYNLWSLNTFSWPALSSPSGYTLNTELLCVI